MQEATDDDQRSPRRAALKAYVSNDLKYAFRRLANQRGVTEADLLRELVDRAVREFDPDWRDLIS